MSTVTDDQVDKGIKCTLLFVYMCQYDCVHIVGAGTKSTRAGNSARSKVTVEQVDKGIKCTLLLYICLSMIVCI